MVEENVNDIDDVSPDQAADMALDGRETDATELPETDGPTYSNQYLDRLFETEGGEPVQKITADYDVSKGPALMIRGVQKFARRDGMPAIADVLLGGVLTAREKQSDGESTTEESTGGVPE